MGNLMVTIVNLDIHESLEMVPLAPGIKSCFFPNCYMAFRGMDMNRDTFH